MPPSTWPSSTIQRGEPCFRSGQGSPAGWLSRTRPCTQVAKAGDGSRGSAAKRAAPRAVQGRARGYPTSHRVAGAARRGVAMAESDEDAFTLGVEEEYHL